MTGRINLFFDLGDTLVDLRPLIPAMASEIRQRLPSLAFHADDISRAWVATTAEETSRAHVAFRPGPQIAGMALRNAVAREGVRMSLPDAARFVQRAWDAYIPNARFHADVDDALALLRSMTGVMGIITDSDSAMVAPLLRRFGIREMFDVVVVSDQVRAYKPDPRIYMAALREGKAEAGVSVFVSDSPTDLEGARAVGMGTVWVRRGGETIRQTGRDWIVRDFRDFILLLESMQ